MSNKIMMTLMAGILAVSLAACANTRSTSDTAALEETAEDAQKESTEEGALESTESNAVKTRDNSTETQVSGEEADSAGMPNPFVDYDTLEEAEDAAGFTFDVPKSVSGNKISGIQVMDNAMIQVIYEGSGDSGITLLRKEKDDGSTEDGIGISGDYTEYREVRTVTIGEYEVTEKGNDGAISVAIWKDGGYQYAADFGEPVDEASAREVIGAMQ